MVRALDRCTGGHGFDSPLGPQMFPLSHARDKLNIASFFSFNIFMRMLVLLTVVCVYCTRGKLSNISTGIQ